ncbi:hypothetical protein AB5J72_28255 [Streptomyces sp. CG1]|uniref:hypothetical protein n=1 Tax=Streptomyces sp. CG1 TaxID=1287523 RepID=UPI0034E1BBE7
MLPTPPAKAATSSSHSEERPVPRPSSAAVNTARPADARRPAAPCAQRATASARQLLGHTPGCIALYDQRTGALYTGGVLYEGDLIDDLAESDPAAYRRSLVRLARLADPGVRNCR